MEHQIDQSDSLTRPRSMLVVADADLNPELFKHLLSQDWSIEYVLSNDEALSAVRRKPFNLILTAECTSANDDIQLLRHIRSVRPHTRMIILTKEGMPEDVLLALREQAFCYFSRPYTLDSLKDAIHMAMEKPCWDDGIEVISGTPSWIRLMVRCDRGTADRLMHFFMEIFNLPEEEKSQLAYAFREMLMNAMEYGGHFDPAQYVEISYLAARHAIACRVKDPGEGFTFDELYHAAVKNPSEDPLRHMAVREEAGTRPGGYGILLSSHLVDELIYNEKGNEVLLIKYLQPSLASLGIQYNTA